MIYSRPLGCLKFAGEIGKHIGEFNLWKAGLVEVVWTEAQKHAARRMESYMGDASLESVVGHSFAD